MAFDPKKFKSLETGIADTKRILEAAGIDLSKEIFTSRDEKAREAMKSLKVTNIPGGFSKWQLPILMQESLSYISVGNADAEVPEHGHDGDGLRVIISGSIIYNGKELTAGDWMWIPAKKNYSIKVGPQGATMFYCYRCTCA